MYEVSVSFFTWHKEWACRSWEWVFLPGIKGEHAWVESEFTTWHKGWACRRWVSFFTWHKGWACRSWGELWAPAEKLGTSNPTIWNGETNEHWAIGTYPSVTAYAILFLSTETWNPWPWLGVLEVKKQAMKKSLLQCCRSRTFWNGSAFIHFKILYLSILNVYEIKYIILLNMYRYLLFSASRVKSNKFSNY